MKSMQDAFNDAVIGVVRQGKPAVLYEKNFSIAPQCRYRAEDGSKCAVGMLIADEHYIPDIEGYPARAAVPNVILSGYMVTGEFLSGLQRYTHDAAARSFRRKKKSFVSVFVELAKAFAGKNGLTMPDLAAVMPPARKRNSKTFALTSAEHVSTSNRPQKGAS